MKAKAMLKALKNMREDAIICFGAGHNQTGSAVLHNSLRTTKHCI